MMGPASSSSSSTPPPMNRANEDESPSKRRRRSGIEHDEPSLPSPSTSNAAAGPSRRSPRLHSSEAEAEESSRSAIDPIDLRVASAANSGRTMTPRRPIRPFNSSSPSISTAGRSRTAPGPSSRRIVSSGGEGSCHPPRSAAAALAPRSASSGNPPSAGSRRVLGEMTLADADRQAREIRSRHEQQEERRWTHEQQRGVESSGPLTPSSSSARAAPRTFSLGRRSRPSSGRGVPTTTASLVPSSDTRNDDSFGSSIFDDSVASTSSMADTSREDVLPSTPREGQAILTAVARSEQVSPSAPRTPSRRARARTERHAQAQVGEASTSSASNTNGSPASDENDDSPGRERRRRREEAAATMRAEAEAKRDDEQVAGEEGADGEDHILLEKGDYREVAAARAVRAGLAGLPR
ncbi:hypothetical protein BDZ90DRAFT_129346 [Jaminaea rosea]|uniref:Uncharacterized protein n=1 Tax=Jaminaea rosea TaxID=1569628 RepID=A0A316UUQ8_9BASI|nr:hypothetical protein BDZ90DRAFT_129346 [Jaminaea rosea]PWN28734.1 hypothetical protein BDZ90DRAFT_129346 [Jaminaea rosea]